MPEIDPTALRNLLILLAGFGMIAVASGQIGHYFRRFRLPLVSGFLLAGIAAGPYVLDLVPEEANSELRFLEEISLAFIAFAAGSELYLSELRSRMRSIRWVTIGQSITFVLGAAAVFFLTEFLPFAEGAPNATRLAIALLAGAILVARSPSSAIAIVNELRAKGPFTQTAMGVTVIMDLLVIALFAVNSEFADALLTNLSFNIGFIILLVLELLGSLLAGLIVALLLVLVLSLDLRVELKVGLMLLVGYGVYPTTFALRNWSHEQLPFEILLEPLLICMVGSFIITNRTSHRNEILRLLALAGPTVYVVFFTLTGITLQLDILAQTWRIALILFAVRLVGIFLGSFVGGYVAGDPLKHNALGWMAYVTQAGVGLGLAREVAVEFPEFGAAFATLLISVIVINQIIGPPFFKFAINRVGEAHTRATTPPFDGVRDAIIFGLDDQAAALARQLESHGWATRVACLDRSYAEEMADSSIDVRSLTDLSLTAMEELELDKADAVITLLSDEDNYRVCELIYEEVGTPTLVARLNDWANQQRFRKLGVLIVHPSTAVVSLLDHFVRAPSTASLLMGTSADQDIVDIEIRDPNLNGLALRDLRLPLDALILSIQRDGHSIITHGYTRLRVGDCVTVVGSMDSLDQISLRFEI